MESKMSRDTVHCEGSEIVPTTEKKDGETTKNVVWLDVSLFCRLGKPSSQQHICPGEYSYHCITALILHFFCLSWIITHTILLRWCLLQLSLRIYWIGEKQKLQINHSFQIEINQ